MRGMSKRDKDFLCKDYTFVVPCNLGHKSHCLATDSLPGNLGTSSVDEAFQARKRDSV